MKELNFEAVRKASERIRPYVHRTPVLTCTALDRMAGAHLFFKCENFQKTGAFKIRGAGNAVLSMTDREIEPGVATHSSGNHGAALTHAASWRGRKAFVVMPENSNPVKKRAASAYGAELVFCRPTLESREATLNEVVEKTGACFVPSYNDHRVIAGQGTAALELMESIRALDSVIVPVGGGGLLSGTAIAVKGMSESTSVYAGEPENASDAYQSLREGHIVPVSSPDTIADGLRTSLGSLTFPIIRDHVKNIFLVSEADILETMKLVWQRMKIIIEPSSAVPLAAVLLNPETFRKQRVGIILSGGNVQLSDPPCTL